MTSNDDRTGSTPGQQPGDPAYPAVPVDQQPTTELPDGAGQQEARSQGLPEDSAAEHASVGSTPRRSRWARGRGAVRTPSTHRGRVALASVAAVALLLIGGGAGAAIGAEAGHGGGDRGGSSQDADGDRGGDRGDGQGGGRGDRGNDADQSTDDQNTDDTTQDDDTTEESTSPTSSSSDSTTSSSTTSAPTAGN